MSQIKISSFVDYISFSMDTTSKEKMFEGIMRPNIEGIYLPKGYEITENIAKFAERYEIPILYG